MSGLESGVSVLYRPRQSSQQHLSSSDRTLTVRHRQKPSRSNTRNTHQFKSVLSCNTKLTSFSQSKCKLPLKSNALNFSPFQESLEFSFDVEPEFDLSFTLFRIYFLSSISTQLFFPFYNPQNWKWERNYFDLRTWQSSFFGKIRKLMRNLIIIS